ncbi:MAG: aminotransferase class IV [Clostridiales bacterium]|uniref:aminotransferase class IV n=1 Tax=Clostridium sp. N3C TaxID=1776758 RepID=UPI00092DF8FA|nr:aminotransferase class IV [Clostridium sp. N3C]NLZ48709.1 aminotransferase class IV [Clostridiales bacterium]SCN21268.1 D-alanine aminotransferase [Clostridium sp. N3C]
MSECFSKHFLKDGQTLSNDVFRDDEIKKGKSVYEVIRIIEGVPLFLKEHIDRFVNSTTLIGKEMLINKKEIENNIAKLIDTEGIKNGNIKIVFNYGDEKDNWYMYFLKHSYPTEEMYKLGVDTILYHGERENPNAKVINLNFRKRVDEAIKNKGVYEAILVDRNGHITEGSKSNIFMVYNNKVITSPVELVLPGVTRGVIISVIKDAGIDFSEERFHYKNLDKLQGLFISGTSPKVLPIRTVDNYSFDSANNEIIRTIKSLYDRRIAIDIGR